MGAVVNISVMEDNVVKSGVLNIGNNKVGNKSNKPTGLSHKLSDNLYNDISLSVFKYKVLLQILSEHKLLPILRIWRLRPYESYRLGEKNDRQSIGGDVNKTHRQFADSEDD